MRLLVFLLTLVIGCRAAEPLLKPNDVVALVGGEDMVVANELGYMEALCQAALPDYHLKFRSIAWEGDTVFEQRRDLNYPTLEAQLDRMGATVVICLFGQKESDRGEAKLGEFATAYQALIARLSDNGKRRLLLLTPPVFTGPNGPDATKQSLARYAEGVASLEKPPGIRTVKLGGYARFAPYRDGIHLTEQQHRNAAHDIVAVLANPGPSKLNADLSEIPRQLIVAKNRLWFHYTRPQNWAFLAGDRTTQPSSRDHVDKNKRWFPEEMEQFLPLIDAKEKEIWAKAAELKGQAQ